MKIWRFVKAKIKLVKYRRKFRGRGVKFDNSCYLAAAGVECEGMNVLNQQVTFRGRIGYGSYIGERSSLNAVVGRYCSISSDVKTISGMHPTKNFVSTHPSFFSTKKQAGFTYVLNDSYIENVYIDADKHLVEIGNDVWIGSNVLILPGVHIGDGAIIAAGAVVVKDVEPYSIVGGVPAKIIRKRFNEEQIEKLIKIQWWNRSREWIKNRIAFFSDIERFISEVNK